MGAGYRFKAKADKTAEIQIYEDVGAGWFGGVTSKDIAKDIKAAGQIDTLNVRIASYGGDVNEGLAIYRMLADHDARVVVHIDGVAASIASVIAMAGDEIVIAEAGSMMIHEGWNIVAGHADEMRKMADHLDKASTQLADIYVARTKNPVAKVKDWMKATTWFYGQEAIDAGFADTLAANVKAVASASLWNSHMQGRIAMQMNAGRIDEPAVTPHPGNADMRALLNTVTDRLRHRAAVSQSRGSGS